MSGIYFDLPKVSKMTINCQLLKVAKWSVEKSISSHGEARSIKLGTLPQEVVTSLPHNHMTDPFFNYRGATVWANLYSKNNSFIEFHVALPEEEKLGGCLCRAPKVVSRRKK